MMAKINQQNHDQPEHSAFAEIKDERLSLIFTCCHPALSQPARIALTLKAVGGLDIGEIARALMVKETTISQRIVRAKRKSKPPTYPTACRGGRNGQNACNPCCGSSIYFQ